MMKRYALILNDSPATDAYMPGNYSVIWRGTYTDENGREWLSSVVAGRDNAGWTLDGYVIPRLASGMYSATEIDLSHPVMMLVPDENNRG